MNPQRAIFRLLALPIEVYDTTVTQIFELTLLKNQTFQHPRFGFLKKLCSKDYMTLLCIIDRQRCHHMADCTEAGQVYHESFQRSIRDSLYLACKSGPASPWKLEVGHLFYATSIARSTGKPWCAIFNPKMNYELCRQSKKRPRNISRSS